MTCTVHSYMCNSGWHACNIIIKKEGINKAEVKTRSCSGLWRRATHIIKPLPSSNIGDRSIYKSRTDASRSSFALRNSNTTQLMRVLPLLLACCIVSVASAAVRVCPRPQQLPSSCGCIERQDTRIVIVTHGPTADGYWTSINEGITTAADRFGIQVEHLAPTRYELAFGSGLKATMGKLLQRAIDLKPDGVILSIPDNSIVKDSLAALASAGDRPRIRA